LGPKPKKGTSKATISNSPAWGTSRWLITSAADVQAAQKLGRPPNRVCPLVPLLTGKISPPARSMSIRISVCQPGSNSRPVADEWTGSTASRMLGRSIRVRISRNARLERPAPVPQE
jgi:hypothetical protein